MDTVANLGVPVAFQAHARNRYDGCAKVRVARTKSVVVNAGMVRCAAISEVQPSVPAGCGVGIARVNQWSQCILLSQQHRRDKRSGHNDITFGA
jgi:hypothetical protein